ncbi:hypothetical protein PN498_09585 [Oscillatoria sp. CS-180]|uniref:hypothetical protein n=1 Tax=Oscillatoria sp. CS-180 TaxID=3021720 RepID=UPI00232C22D6|nr:hypothetical protein [Oscillatoria sp. CS-180]MDB9526237.1 hypothetical protein [Oscillatoria sp. CS-180]
MPAPSDLSEAVGCPLSAIHLPLETVRQQTISGRDRYFNRFDYAPKAIAIDETTVRFQAREYDFVYCRGDGQWTVQPGRLGKEWIAQLDAQHRGENEFSTLRVDNQVYQYRVTPKPTSAEFPEDYRSVVLELILPGQETPEQHTLYTFEQLPGADIVPQISRLGLPRITSAQRYGDRLWWTIAFEQGEGLNGIATIVNYDLATNTVSLIQPSEIKFQQILDLALTGNPEQPTLWMGIRVSGEGMSNAPASGLVVYQPDSKDLTTGTMQSYTPHNSPLVGHIPSQLAIDADQLWVGTRNGVCSLDWQTHEQLDSWNCWRFIAQAMLPADETVPVYASLLNPTPAATLAEVASGETVEVLWWMLTAVSNSPMGRYEIRLETGWEVTLDQGASLERWPRQSEIAGRVPLYWQGHRWHWQGDRFVRPFDGHLNNLIAGDQGIGPPRENSAPFIDWHAIRGDLELLELSAETTRVRYYSGWVDDTLLTPLPAVVERPHPETTLPNPLIEIDSQLRRSTTLN